MAKLVIFEGLGLRDKQSRWYYNNSDHQASYYGSDNTNAPTVGAAIQWVAVVAWIIHTNRVAIIGASGAGEATTDGGLGTVTFFERGDTGELAAAVTKGAELIRSEVTGNFAGPTAISIRSDANERGVTVRAVGAAS